MEKPILHFFFYLMAHHTLKTKLVHAVRIDLAVKLVWQATPLYTMGGGIAILLSGLLPLASAYMIKLIIDAVVEIVPSSAASVTEPQFSKIFVYILGAGFLALGASTVQSISQYLKKAQSLGVADHVYSIIHKQACRVDLSFYESSRHRDTLFRAQQEGPYRPTSIVNGLFTAGQSAVSFTGTIGILFVFNPVLPLLMILAAIPGIFLRLRHSDSIYSWQKNHTEEERKATYLHWMLTEGSHAQELRIFDTGRCFSQQFAKLQKTLRTKKLQYEKQRTTGDLIAQTCTVVSLFAALIYIALCTVQGKITIGDMVLYFQLFQKGMEVLKTLLETLARMYEDNLFLSHLYSFLAITPQITIPANPVPVPENIQTGISFENVSFSYRGQGRETHVLDRISFSLSPGQIIALVGENGSGKSTIAKLLTRMYDPDQGKICLDSVDIRKFDPSLYRKKLSAVFQDHMRYYLSVRENICIGDVEQAKDFQKMIQAARSAAIHNEIEALPKGYDTILGNWFSSGKEISKGQWQMIAIARAFFRDADIIVLDEPASSLDPMVQARFFSNIRKLAKNRSVLLISHRYTHLKMADKILLLDRGRIVEQGNHQELMTLNKKYARLYKMQAEQYI